MLRSLFRLNEQIMFNLARCFVWRPLNFKGIDNSFKSDIGYLD